MAKYKADFSKREINSKQLETLARYCSLADYLSPDAVAAIMGFEKIEGDK